MKRPWLLPLAPLYRAGQILLDRGKEQGAEVLEWPVISVGNLSTGGTGKTPFTIGLAGLLGRLGYGVDILSRGYGRVGNRTEQVDAGGDDWARFGDEPMLMARATGLPVYVGARRFEAGKLAERELGAAGDSATRVHLLDDGFQHRRLSRTVDLVMVNSEDLGDRLLPAGDLREPLTALNRASVLAIPADDEAAADRLRSLHLGPAADQPIWRFKRRMVVPERVKAGSVFAFCGIARPEQFFRGLERAGVMLVGRKAFTDHHRYQPREIEALVRLASGLGAASMVTTAKDLVRLAGLGGSDLLVIEAVDLEIVLEEEAGIAAWLRARLEARLDV